MSNKNNAPLSMVILAFALVYVVWGSTYFFIQNAVKGFTPLVLGSIRFLTAGFILLGICYSKGLKIFKWRQIKIAALSGFLLLFLDNGMFIWAEQFLPSSLAATMASTVTLWFVFLDKRQWKENFTSKKIILGIFIGLVGVVLLFWERLQIIFHTGFKKEQVIALLMLTFGPSTWAIGSLYAKYKSKEDDNAFVSTGWQMFFAGIIFLISSLFTGDFQQTAWTNIPVTAIYSVIYLIIFGSLLAYTSYVWLLQVKSATLVSTHAYVNPVIAVFLGALFGHEDISFIQIIGLLIILSSVLLISKMKIKWNIKRRKPQLMS
jgi:drug/metabolite transporter (DMT)-like permease